MPSYASNYRAGDVSLIINLLEMYPINIPSYFPIFMKHIFSLSWNISQEINWPHDLIKHCFVRVVISIFTKEEREDNDLPLAALPQSLL